MRRITPALIGAMFVVLSGCSSSTTIQPTISPANIATPTPTPAPLVVDIGVLPEPALFIYLPPAQAGLPLPSPVAAGYTASTVGAASAVAANQFHDLPLPAFSITEARWILAEAGWPEQEWDAVLTIGRCEAGTGNLDDPESWWFYPGEVGDGGNSLGWLQLNKGWWWRWPDEGWNIAKWMNPVEVAKLGKRIWEARGFRYGGGGGWSCADRFGIR